jgi:hypothetical protein
MRAERRLFGVVPSTLTFVVACFLLALAAVLLAARNWIVGVALLACSGALFVVFYSAARRDPTSALARTALRASSRIRGWVGFVGESAGAWSEAGRDLVRRRRELRALRAERSREQFALGGAAYAEDDVEVATLRARLRDLDHAIADRERAAAETLARARRRVARERFAIQPTQQLSSGDDGLVPDQGVSEPADAPSDSAEVTANREKKSNRKTRKPAGEPARPPDH